MNSHGASGVGPDDENTPTVRHGGRGARRGCGRSSGRSTAGSQERLADAPRSPEQAGPAEEVADASGGRIWVVLLEAAPAADRDAAVVGVRAVRAILAAMGDAGGVGLHCPDRVAVQVRLAADDPAMALAAALARWRPAAVHLMEAGWSVVRVEVLTPDEFRQDCQSWTNPYTLDRRLRLGDGQPGW